MSSFQTVSVVMRVCSVIAFSSSASSSAMSRICSGFLGCSVICCGGRF